MVGVQNIITLDEFNDSTIVKNESSETALEVDDTPMLETKVAANSSEKENVPDSDEDIIFISHSTNSTYVKKEPGRQLEATGSLSNDSIVKQESGILSSGTNKRRLATSDEEPIAKRVDKTVVTYVSSEEDPQAVDTICKYISEFQRISTTYGFDITIQCENEGKREIKLIQSTTNCRSRKAFQEMDALLKSKMENNGDLTAKVTEIEHKLTACQKQIDQLSAGRREVPPTPTPSRVTPTFPFGPLAPSRDYTYAQTPALPSYNENVVLPGLHQQRQQVPASRTQTLDNLLNSMQQPRTVTFAATPRKEAMFFQKSLETIANIKSIGVAMCAKIQGNLRKGFGSPFYQCRKWIQKQAVLLKYLDFVQNNKLENKCHLLKISAQFMENAGQFLYEPTVTKLRANCQEVQKRFKLEENIVGSVHFMPYVNENRINSFYCLVIVDFMIVCWGTGPTKEAALVNVFGIISQSKKWDKTFKFAIDIPIVEFLKDLFIFSEKPELFLDNQLAVVWLTYNFKCLPGPLFNYHEAAIPALYNMAFSFFYNLE